jgi:hypothetical protein
MRLIDLDPHWVGSGGEGISDAQGNPVPARHGVGVSFLCPCAACTAKRTGDPDQDFYLRHYIPLTNPLDGGPAVEKSHPVWQRAGETFETLQLSPSILSDPEKDGCGWHGYIGKDVPGDVTQA